MVSETPSYNGLTKALTTLLDTAFTKPYLPAHISTQTPQLLSVPAVPPPGRVLRTALHAGFYDPDLKAEALRERMAKSKFRPLHDRVVVKRIDAEDKTRGGIIIPDSAREKPSQGEVVAVGPGGRDEAGKLIPIDIKVGDRVLFGKWSGTEVKLDGEELLIMKESDIMGVLV